MSAPIVFHAWKPLMEAAIAHRSAKGFQPIVWINAPNRLACISKEIHEVELALQAFSDRSPLFEGWFDLRKQVEHELADVTIYCLTVQADLGLEAGTARLGVQWAIPRFASPSEVTRPLRSAWAHTFEAWQKDRHSDFRIGLDMIIAHAIAIRERVAEPHDDTNIIVDCYRKLELMKDRPALHGGKDPLA